MRWFLLLAVLCAGCQESKGFHYDEFGHPSSAAPRPVPAGRDPNDTIITSTHGDITT